MSAKPVPALNTNLPILLEPFADLKRRVEITRDARFQANLRLERRQRASYFTISMLSLFVIILSLLPNIFDLSPQGGQALLALTVVNSVFVIITTFLEASGNYVHKGEQLHRSARNIAKVFYKLMLLGESERITPETIRDLQEEYQIALDDCPFYHDNIDRDLIQMTKPSLFNSKVHTGFGSPLFTLVKLLQYKLKEYLWLLPHSLMVIVSIGVVAAVVSGTGPF